MAQDPEKLFLSEESEREDDGYKNLEGKPEEDHNGRWTAKEDTQRSHNAIRASHRRKGGLSGGDDDQITLRAALRAQEDLAAEDADAPPSGVTKHSTREGVKLWREDTPLKIEGVFFRLTILKFRRELFPSSGEANALKTISPLWRRFGS